MRKASRHIFAITTLLLCGHAALSLAHSDWKYLGDFDDDEVFVVVESGGGFGGQMHRAALAGSGKFALVGAYSDSTTIRSVIEPDLALAFISDLLAIDFMGQPEVFRNIKGAIHRNEDGRLVVSHTEVIDSGLFRITLHLGAKSHAVTIRLPAYGAPEALQDWMGRFRELVKDQARWVAF